MQGQASVEVSVGNKDSELKVTAKAKVCFHSKKSVEKNGKSTWIQVSVDPIVIVTP